VLRLFMVDPTRAYYQRQIEAATGLAIRAVQRELERLSSIDLLFRHSEGNRTYYQVDRDFPLFNELRALVLRCCEPIDRLRGELTTAPGAQVVLHDVNAGRVLVVYEGDTPPNVWKPEGLTLDWRTRGSFLESLRETDDSVVPYLAVGQDLLGRREDVLWRRIEHAGYTIPKAKGVA
jgi:hypothetical protein